MASIPLPALDIKPVQQTSPLETYTRIMQLNNMMVQGQGAQLENQKRVLELGDDAKIRQAAHDAIDPDTNRFDGDKFLQNSYSNGVPPSNPTLRQYQKDLMEMRTNVATLQGKQIENTQKLYDQYRGRLMSIISGPDEQKLTAWDREVAAEEKAGIVQPGTVTHVYPGDDVAQSIANHFAIGSTLAKEHSENVQASARASQAATAQQRLNEELPGGALFKGPSDDTLSYFAAKGDKQSQAILDARAAQRAKAAGQTAGAEAAAKFPYELQLKQQELAQNPVFAVNPKTNQRELTTVGDAKAQGFTNPIKASQVDVEKETQLNSQLNDLQLNTSRYKAALNAMGNLSKTDVANMTRVLSDKSIGGFLANELTLGAVMDQISQGEKASAWNALSPDKQAALIGSLRMRNSALLFQKVATGMGRASKEALDIELSNMPSPIEGATVGNQKIQAFQENVDQMAARSVKLPWMEQPRDVKNRIEGQAMNQYNQQQAAKPQGKYKAASGNAVRVGQNIQLPRTPGLSRVTKVYPDGTFDAEQ